MVGYLDDHKIRSVPLGAVEPSNFLTGVGREGQRDILCVALQLKYITLTNFPQH